MEPLETDAFKRYEEKEQRKILLVLLLLKMMLHWVQANWIIPAILKEAKKIGIKHYFIEDESSSYQRKYRKVLLI